MNFFIKITNVVDNNDECYNHCEVVYWEVAVPIKNKYPFS